MEFVYKHESGTVLKIYVQPGAKESVIVGLYGNPPRLKVKIKAPPVDGEANGELLRYLSEFFKIKKSEIEIIRGLTSRQKDVFISLNFSQIKERLKIIY